MPVISAASRNAEQLEELLPCQEDQLRQEPGLGARRRSQVTGFRVRSAKLLNMWSRSGHCPGNWVPGRSGFKSQACLQRQFAGRGGFTTGVRKSRFERGSQAGCRRRPCRRRRGVAAAAPVRKRESRVEQCVPRATWLANSKRSRLPFEDGEVDGCAFERVSSWRVSWARSTLPSPPALLTAWRCGTAAGQALALPRAPALILACQPGA